VYNSSLSDRGCPIVISLVDIEMRSRPLVAAVPVEERFGVPIGNQSSQVDIPALNALALRSLVLLYHEKTKLFSRRLTVTGEGVCQEEGSPGHTIVALLGLQRLRQTGVSLPFDVTAICDAVLRDTSWVRSIGDLGLLTWFTAECFPGRLGILFNAFDFEKALRAYPDGRQGCTVGLSWFLTGIARARLACCKDVPDPTDIAAETYHLLLENQGDSGIFGHALFHSFLLRTFWHRFGTFADQIYAIYALTNFARAFQIEEPLSSALACANSVRSLQGDMGQWWFLYDKCACRVVNRYPVLSLHQNGTAPLALLALEETIGQNFRDSIYTGLSWVTGTNELGDDLRSLDPALIWDSIGPRKWIAKYWEGSLSCVNGSHCAKAKSLRIRYEARPDHFGWLLYAFGGFGLPSGAEERASIGRAGRCAV
jgi:hypothetical protein